MVGRVFDPPYRTQARASDLRGAPTSRRERIRRVADRPTLMDFFEAQARAKKRTSRLVALFALAVIGTILASYVAAIGILGLAGPRTHRRSSYYDSGYGNRSALDVTPWQPGVFVVVATGML